MLEPCCIWTRWQGKEHITSRQKTKKKRSYTIRRILIFFQSLNKCKYNCGHWNKTVLSGGKKSTMALHLHRRLLTSKWGLCLWPAVVCDPGTSVSHLRGHLSQQADAGTDFPLCLFTEQKKKKRQKHKSEHDVIRMHWHALVITLLVMPSCETEGGGVGGSREGGLWNCHPDPHRMTPSERWCTVFSGFRKE